MAVEWSERVNTKFYGADGTFVDNTEKVEFKSGRTVRYRKNSFQGKKYSVLLYLNDIDKIDGKTEFQWFLDWFLNTAKSGTEHFKTIDIVAKSGAAEYEFTAMPTWNGLARKEVSLEIEEVG